MTKISALILLCLLTATTSADARIARSAAARAEFKHLHACPSTGLHKGACPGYVIDHVTPLCAGGADAPANMQWQTKADAKAKDRNERRMCRQAA